MLVLAFICLASAPTGECLYAGILTIPVPESDAPCKAHIPPPMRPMVMECRVER